MTLISFDQGFLRTFRLKLLLKHYVELKYITYILRLHFRSCYVCILGLEELEYNLMSTVDVQVYSFIP